MLKNLSKPSEQTIFMSGFIVKLKDGVETRGKDFNEVVNRYGRTVHKGRSPKSISDSKIALYSHTDDSRKALKRAKKDHKIALVAYCSKNGLDIKKTMNVPL